MKYFAIVLICVFSQAALSEHFEFNAKVHGTGKPVILIPGLNSSGEVWAETVAKYQGHYQLHALTLPGFAGQAATTKKDFLVTMRDQILAYIKYNKLDKPIIIGHSLGGVLAMQIAIEDSDIVEKIVIVDSLPFLPAGFNPVATVESSKAFAETLRQQIQSQTETQYRASAPQHLGNMTLDPARLNTIVEWGAQSDPTVSGQAMYELYTTDLRKDISAINVPTLVLGAWVGYKNYGATRASTMAMLASQYQALKGVDIQLTDTGKHFIMWDDPEFFFAQLEKFL